MNLADQPDFRHLALPLLSRSRFRFRFRFRPLLAGQTCLSRLDAAGRPGRPTDENENENESENVKGGAAPLAEDE
jgi:hypothetical protein